MSETAVETKYQVRSVNPSDLDFLMRGQFACRYEVDQLTREDIEFGLWNNTIEGFVLVGPNVRMCIVVQRFNNSANLCAFYREGPITGMWTESQILWRKVVDYLQENNITDVMAHVHKDNPNRDKLLRFYTRLGFGVEMVRIGRRI